MHSDETKTKNRKTVIIQIFFVWRVLSKYAYGRDLSLNSSFNNLSNSTWFKTVFKDMTKSWTFSFLNK